METLGIARMHAYLRQFLLVDRHQRGVDGNLGGRESGRRDKVERGVSGRRGKYACMNQGRDRIEMRDLPNELAPEPEERLLKVVI